jgi:hypothetical protein
MATNNAINANSTTPLPIVDGGTQVTSVTVVPAATAFAGWDANKNLTANNHIDAYTTTATAAGTTTLTVGSTHLQYFTGSTTQTVVLPVTSTLVLGQSFYIANNSSGVVTVQSSGLNNIVAMAASTVAVFTCILTSGTTAASWTSDYNATVAGVNSITGTANQVIASASTGAVTLSLPQSIATTSAVQFNTVQLNTTNGILDTNGNVILSLSPQASAVNYVQILNSPTTAELDIEAAGSDTNIALGLNAKGSSVVAIKGGVGGTQPLAVYNGTALQHSTLFSFSNTAAARTVTFPDANGTVVFGITETSWTPTFSFATVGNLSVAYVTQQGNYLQIGNIVFFNFDLAFTPTFTTSSGSALISSFPVSANASNGYSFYTMLSNNTNFTFTSGYTYLAGEIHSGSTNSFFVEGGSGKAFATLTTTSFATGTAYEFLGSGFYFV